ncbi:unnamed protein product [Adineta ricciae]|uniref:RRM domain-containing protein n=1 Tax=Adineta ricciae TaxID=249248 RepID=A0A814VXF7_ADIRI|nr:unnamed protein product [Adineta ricciae]
MTDKYRNFSKTYSRTKSSISDDEDYERKRRKSSECSYSQRTSSLDGKVYVGNVPTDDLSDRELLEFFRPFGKISGKITISLAEKLLFLIQFKDIRVYKNHLFVQYENLSNADQLIQQGQSSLFLKGNKLDILPAMKISVNGEQINCDNSEKTVCSKNSSYQKRRSSFSDDDQQKSFVIQPDNSQQFIGCQIILVNHRQRNYAEEISSYLENHGLTTSILVIRENYSLHEAIDDAIEQKSLYGIIILPMHEDRRSASFHILHGQIEEHRNLKLEDVYELILNNYSMFKQKSCQIPTIQDKLPLSTLLCLLADGRQLTLDEIDRVLVYLLEKKAYMLNLPTGKLPPLPVEYANYQKDSSSNELSPRLIEQIREIFNRNLKKTPVFQEEHKSNETYPTSSLSQSMSNCSTVDNSTAIFQAYTQFNGIPPLMSINHQQIRK